MSEHAIQARVAYFPPVTQEDVMMYMPAGLNTICASRGGEPVIVTVLVEPSTAAVVQQQFEMLKARSRQRPFFDFNHEGKEASGWPIEFFWSESPEPGVYVKTEFSAAGLAARSGKTHRGFSPTFWTDGGNPERVVAKQYAELNMGGMVNDPAFERILPLWAKRAVKPGEPQTQHTYMTDQELAALQAKHTTAKSELAGLKAANASSELIAAKEKEIAAINQQIKDGEKDKEIAELKAEKKKLAEAKADAAIKAAVDRGAIPAQDEALKAQWKKAILGDDGNIALLEKLQADPAITAGRVVTSGVSVVTEAMANVVRGYHALRSPSERGAFWAANMRDRIDKEWQQMITAANTLGTLSGDLVVQRSLDLLKYEFPMLTRVSTDFSNEAAALNQSIITRLREVPTVANYSAEDGYEDQNAEAADVPVVINQHKYTQVSFNVNELASTRRQLFPENEEGMHYAIGKSMVDTLLALITAANFTEAPTVSALNDFQRRSVIAMKTALNKRKVNGGTRTLLLNSDYHSKLEEDIDIVSALVNTGAGSSIATGKLPPISGFMPVEADYLPAAGNLVGFGFRADALALAARVPNDYTTAQPGVPATGIVRVVTNPDTGMSVLLTQYVDHQKGKSTCRLATMFGVAKGNIKCGQRLVSAAPPA